MNAVIVADARDLPLASRSHRACVTSVPYWGMRDYGHARQIGLEPNPTRWVRTLVGVFREVRRVLTDDGSLWLNVGDAYAGSGKGAWSNREAPRKEKYRPEPGSGRHAPERARWLQA